MGDNRFIGYEKRDVVKDLIAGIIVGIVAIPLGMAFAIASGVKPEYGLYTTIIAGIIIAIMGGSRFQIGGPTGAFIPLLLAVSTQFGYEKLLLAGMLAGVFLLLMGFFRLGGLIKFIPRPVTIGFTSGIAVIIFTGQIPGFLGLKGIEKHEAFHENMLEMIHKIGTFNYYSIFVALIGLVVLLVVPRISRKIPSLLVALLIPTLLSAFFFPGQTATIGSVYGGIPQSLPPFHMPAVSLNGLIELIGPAFAIAVLGGIESLLSAVVADGMSGHRHNSNRELIGQGLANVITPLFGGIPATGAIARTATNIKSGAVSPLSGIFHGITVLLTLLLFAPYASYIPLAAMAPILMMVAWNMSERHEFSAILKMKTGDSLVLVLTFLLTVFFNLTTAVEIGLLLAMVLFVTRMGNQLQVQKALPDHERQRGKVTPQALSPGNDCPQLSIYTIDGPLFFGAAHLFENTLVEAIQQKPEILLLRMGRVPFIDATGQNHLDEMIRHFQRRGGTILISGLKGQPLTVLQKSGLFHRIGGESHFFSHTGEALNYGLTLLKMEKCKGCRHQAFKECAVFSQITMREAR